MVMRGLAGKAREPLKMKELQSCEKQCDACDDKNNPQNTEELAVLSEVLLVLRRILAQLDFSVTCEHGKDTECSGQ